MTIDDAMKLGGANLVGIAILLLTNVIQLTKTVDQLIEVIKEGYEKLLEETRKQRDDVTADRDNLRKLLMTQTDTIRETTSEVRRNGL